MARLHFQLDDDLHRQAKSAAALRGIPLKDYVTQAIADALKRDARRSATWRKK